MDTIHFPPRLLASAGLAGVLVQLLISRTREVPTMPFLTLYGLGEIAVVSLLHHLLGAHVSVVSAAVQMNVVFLTVLVSLTVVRRMFFHPLCCFPGPRMAAASGWYAAYLSSEGRLGHELRALHNELGDIVRMGPNEVSCIDVNALGPLYSKSLSHNSRGPFYEISGLIGETSLVTERGSKKHAVLKRIWDPAFKPAAIREYEPIIEKHVAVLAEVLEGKADKEVNVVEFVSHMGFDIMAELGFGKHFGMQDGTGNPAYVNFMHKFMRFTSFCGALPHLCNFIRFMPKSPAVRAFQKLVEDMLTERLAKGSGKSKDVMEYLLEPDEDTGKLLSPGEMFANVVLLIVAGAEPTSNVLSCMFLELARNPEIQAKLYAEVSAHARNVDQLNVQNTKGLKYLQAVIDETLRLWPPGIRGIQALVGPDGMSAAGSFIPPYTAVRIPSLATQTDDRYFPQGKKFIPERWTERPELVRDRRALFAFSCGEHACLGKNLGLAEIRLTAAKMVEQFELRLGESWDEKKFLGDWKDYYTVSLGKISLKFRPRR